MSPLTCLLMQTMLFSRAAVELCTIHTPRRELANTRLFSMTCMDNGKSQPSAVLIA